MNSLERELRELVELVDHRPDLFELLLLESLGDAAGHAPDVLRRPATHDALDLLRLAARLDHRAADLETDLGDHAQHIAFGRVGVGAHDEVGGGEGVEMGDVAVQEVGVVVHLTQLDGERRHFAAEAGVDRLGAGHVVRRGAHAADASHEPRELLDRPTHDEALKTAQLGDLEDAVLYGAVVVEEDLDLAVTLEAGDRIDADLPRHVRTLLCSSDDGRLNR